MQTTITSNKYWNEWLEKALLTTGYLPNELIYMITTSKDLAKYITPEIIKKWYKEQNNIKDVVIEIHYIRSINENYFSQSNNVRDLEDIIAEVYHIDKINFYNDKVAIIQHKGII